MVDVRNGDRQIGMGERSHQTGLEARAATRVDVARAQGLAEDALDQIGLLVRGPVADQRGGGGTGLAEALDGHVQGTLPGRRPQPSSVANERREDPLRGLRGLVSPASLVAEPAVVDVVVLACDHALDALVAHRKGDVALGRAQRAHRPCVLDVPRPCAKPVGGVGERADGAELDDVAGERRDVGPTVEGPDESVVGPLEEDQLVVLRDLLREAHAAVAEDATLPVDRDERRQCNRLREISDRKSNV